MWKQLSLLDTDNSISLLESGSEPTPAASPESPKTLASQQRASRVKTLAQQARVRALKAREAGFFGTCSESSKRADRLGFSLRTWLRSELPELKTILTASAPLPLSFTDWRSSVIPSCRQLWWVLTTLERPTNEIEPGSSPDWPTPTAQTEKQSDTYARGNPTLKGAVASWPTPTARCVAGPGGNREGGPNLQTAVLWPTPASSLGGQNATAPTSYLANGKHGLNLQGAVQMWTTPSTRDYKDSPGMALESSDGRTRLDQLPRQVFFLDGLPDPDKSNTNGKNRAQLNSRWVAQLMGLPADWCEIPTEPAENP